MAKEIAKTIQLVSDNTGMYGTNPEFYNDVARKLKKLNTYNIEKLHDILTVTIVLERL